MKLKEQMFDFEVFPNWWCCVIGEYPEDQDIPESIKDTFTVISSDMIDAKDKLLEIMTNREYVNMGYNIKHYDNIILNGVACGFSPRQLKILSELIINPEKEYDSVENMRIFPFTKRRYNNFIYQDLFDDLATGDRERGSSLKEKEACMQLDIRESNVPFDKEDLTDADKEDIISYCKHDVWACMMLYKIVLYPFIATKVLISDVFGVPIDVCYKSTNANLAGKVLGAKRTSFPDADREDIEIPDGIKEYIKYSLPRDVIDKLTSSTEGFMYKLFGNEVSYSNGGIHSILKNNIVAKSNDEWALINADGTSFYPAIMIYWKTLSRAVAKPEKFEEMYNERREFKKVIEPFEDKWGKNTKNAPVDEYKHYKYCKDTSQAYKLVLNTASGAAGNKYLDLYDKYHCTKNCRLSQLILTSLANNVYNQVGKDKVQIMQTNTDGILFYIRRDMIDLLYAIGDEFTRVTHIDLEYEEEDRIWQRDVNNYVMFKKNGREKSKGSFFVTDMIQPGYNRTRPLDSYVCRDAMKYWLTEGKDIVEHIYGEKDLSKFVITCHKGSFSGILREYTDGTPDEILHKVNRVYASLTTRYGMIMKTKKVHGEIRKYKAPGCPPHCELVNQALAKYDMAEVSKDIDYIWYANRCLELMSDPWYELKADKIVPIVLIDKYK
jgi:hypothetical protein